MEKKLRIKYSKLEGENTKLTKERDDAINRMVNVTYDLNTKIEKLEGKLQAAQQSLETILKLTSEARFDSELMGNRPLKSEALKIRELLFNLEDVVKKAVLGETPTQTESVIREDAK